MPLPSSLAGISRLPSRCFRLVVFGLVLISLRIVRRLETFRPLVIRIDELGRAQALSYETLTYKPEYKETKYFLTRFCQLYYRRNRSTINDDFTQAMSFLDGKLASDTIEGFKQKGIIKNFLADSLAARARRGCAASGHRADGKTSVPSNRGLLRDRVLTRGSFRREAHTVYGQHSLFTFRDHVPNEDILVNPLGLDDHLFPGRRGLREMIRNCLFLSATALLLVCLVWLAGFNSSLHGSECLFFHCGASIAFFLGVLGVNLFAATLAINRKILLKDTGRKLSHFDNQLQAGSPEGLPPFLMERQLAMSRWDISDPDRVHSSETRAPKADRSTEPDGASPFPWPGWQQ